MQENLDGGALLLVNFENHFMSRDGFGKRFGNNSSRLQHIVQPAKEVFYCACTGDMPVIHTYEGPHPNLVDVTAFKAGDGALTGSEGQNRWSMIRGQWGNGIISELEKLSDGSETVVDKTGKGYPMHYLGNILCYIRYQSIVVQYVLHF